MISSVSGINYMISALNRTGRSAGGNAVSGTPPKVDLQDTVSIRKLKPGSAARLYLANGLLEGHAAPGGAGAAREIQSDGQTLAASAGPVFVAQELPSVPRASYKMRDKIQDTLASREKPPVISRQTGEEKPSLLERIASKKTDPKRGFQLEQESIREPRSGGFVKLETTATRDRRDTAQEPRQLEMPGARKSLGGYRSRAVEAYRSQSGPDVRAGQGGESHARGRDTNGSGSLNSDI